MQVRRRRVASHGNVSFTFSVSENAPYGLWGLCLQTERPRPPRASARLAAQEGTGPLTRSSRASLELSARESRERQTGPGCALRFATSFSSVERWKTGGSRAGNASRSTRARATWGTGRLACGAGRGTSELARFRTEGRARRENRSVLSGGPGSINFETARA